jgi:hypothetical protein
VVILLCAREGMKTRTALPALPPRHARTVLPGVVHDELSHLAIDLQSTMGALLVDGAILLLRYHGRGDDLPEPPEPPEPKGGAR